MKKERFLRRLRQQKKTLGRTELYSLFQYHLLIRQWDNYPRFKFQPKPPPAKVENMLVVQLSSIGDVTCTIPALFALKERFPAAELHFLTEAESTVGVLNHPAIDKLWTLPAESWIGLLKSGQKQNFVSELRAWLHQLKKQRFDFLLNLHSSPLSALIGNLLDPDSYSGCLIDNNLQPVVIGSPHQFARYLDQPPPVHTLGATCLYADAVPEKMQFYRRQDDKIENKVEEIFANKHQDNRPHVLINTGSRMKGRVWPPDHCSQVVEQLLEAGCEVGLIGGPSDFERLEKIDKQIKNPRLISWYKINDSLLADLHLSDQANLTVTTDSGPQHLISARDNRCLVLAGDIWVGPWTDRSLTLQSTEKKIGSLPVELIVQTVLAQLEHGEPPQPGAGVDLFRGVGGRSFWFRNIPVGQKSSNETKMRRWLKKIYLYSLLEQVGSSLGWKGLGESPLEHLEELYELYWSVEKPDIPYPKIDQVLPPGLSFLAEDYELKWSYEDG